MARRIDIKEFALLEDVFSDVDVRNPDESDPGSAGTVMEPSGGVFLLVSGTEVFFITRATKVA
jgi:hypothetical protein